MAPDFFISDFKPPRIVPKEILKLVRSGDQGGEGSGEIGYAMNPHYRRGAPYGEAARALAPARNRRAESKSLAKDAKKREALIKAETGAGNESPLPEPYRRVEARLPSDRARFEEFDFRAYNKTRLRVW